MIKHIADDHDGHDLPVSYYCMRDFSVEILPFQRCRGATYYRFPLFYYSVHGDATVAFSQEVEVIHIGVSSKGALLNDVARVARAGIG